MDKKIELLKEVCCIVSTYTDSSVSMSNALKQIESKEGIVRYLIELMLNNSMSTQTCEIFEEFSNELLLTNRYSFIAVVDLFKLYTMTEFLKNN
jgi:esterase/lipase superfamily enzyme